MPKSTTPASISLDFSKVEDRREGGGRALHAPEGDYLMKVVGCEKRHKKGEETGPGYLSWRCIAIKPEGFEKKGSVWHITSLIEENLWNLRNFLEDLGVTVPKKVLRVPIAQIVEKQLVFGATLEDDDYNPEKIKSKVSATFPKKDYEATAKPEDDDDDDEEEEEEEAEEASDDDDDEELSVDDL